MKDELCAGDDSHIHYCSIYASDKVDDSLAEKLTGSFDIIVFQSHSRSRIYVYYIISSELG